MFMLGLARKDAMSTIISVDTRDIRFPTSLEPRRLGRDEPRPRLLGGLRRDPHRRRRRPRGPRLRLHDRARQRRAGRRASTRSRGHLRRPATSRRCSPTWAPRRDDSSHDSQLRWLGPEKGVMHMAIGAVVNALWDLRAKRAGLPLWQLPRRAQPRGARRRSSTSATSPTRSPPTRRSRSCAPPSPAAPSATAAAPRRPATPPTRPRPAGSATPTRSSTRLCREAVADGFTQIKLKVGADLDDDIRRLRIAREAVGPDFPIAIDANQRWDVSDARSSG